MKMIGEHMKRFKTILPVLLFGLVLSCASCPDDANQAYKDAMTIYDSGKFALAIEKLEAFVDCFEDNENYDEALFMLGFINANYVKDYDLAEKYYTTFIQKFPNHELTPSAEMELKNLGKSPEEYLNLPKND
jgi:TolA-binding protein